MMKQIRTYMKVGIEITSFAPCDPEDVVEAIYRELTTKCKEIDNHMGGLASVSIKALPHKGEVIRTSKEKPR